MLFRFPKPAFRHKVTDFVFGDLSAEWQKMEKHAIDELEQSLLDVFFEQVKTENIHFDSDISIIRYLINLLKEQIQENYKTIRSLQLKYADYAKKHKYATSDTDKKKHILDFAEQLGASARQLEADRQALQLWFDHDAISDRFHFILSGKEKQLSFSLTRLAHLTRLYIDFTGQDTFTLQQWQHLEIEQLVMPLFNYHGNEQIRLSAFKLMSQSILSLRHEIIHEAFSENVMRYLYRSALDNFQDIWIQTEALGLLASVAPENFRLVYLHRFKHTHKQDDIFVRHHAVLLLEHYFVSQNFEQELLDVVLQDDSPYVRQALAQVITCLPYDIAVSIYEHVLFHDSCVQVRAALLLSILVLLETSDDTAPLLALVARLLEQEQDEFVLRVLMDQIPQWIRQLQGRPDVQNRWLHTLFPLLGEHVIQAPRTRIRRWAATAREWCWCYALPERYQTFQQLEQDMSRLYRHDHIRVLKSMRGKANEDEVARLLALNAQQNEGVDLKPRRRGFTLFRKPFFVFRWWRAWYEFKHSSIDKRQAHSHTVGRLSRGRIYIPSDIEAELSLTKVPGEPFYIEQEDGWRPFLPLVDDIISILDPLLYAPPVKIVTAQGVTRIEPPQNPVRRIMALTTLTRKFAYFARLRNWEEGQQGQANEYIQALEKLGLRFSFQPHQYDYDQQAVNDSSIQRLFGFGVPIPFVDLLSSFRDYFYSIYENNLSELLIFLSLGSAWFMGRHIVINRMIARSRRSIGLVVGGWGTRGKSGTERLKAGLFNALGFSVVSKTTGCEAMFLHAYAYGQLREMFLFRPYDKATIWEQANVLALARKMKTDVFLWECMGLTPAYVEILQRQWMKDDIATITNTYPDHEDLQGPAGYNIPQVMTRFIPGNSVLITTEEQMQPILKKEASLQNTRFIQVGWKEAGLLTEDVLKRFPYDEHPYNIALVLAMARELDISPVFALKEMADKVVPDLGVLKTYPSSVIQSRTLTFVMGMSANERYGALGNWKRMGFDALSRKEHPQVWVSALINNRADRIPRSRVFADLLINDVSVDAIYLIGTNLHGFMGYLQESWEQNCSAYMLDDSQAGNEQTQAVYEDRHQRLLAIGRHFRLPCSWDDIRIRLEVMLNGLGETELAEQIHQALSSEQLLTQELLDSLPWQQELTAWLKQEQKLLEGFQDIEKALHSDASVTQINTRLKQLLWFCFENKIVIVEDEHASGDQIIHTIVQQTPPGLENRIMGMQNIKGTGLDFVYRWLAWDYCYQALNRLASEKPDEFAQGLKQLMTFQEYSALCEHQVTEVVQMVKNKPWAQRESFQAELELIETRMRSTLETISLSRTEQNASSRWKLALVNFIEEILDTSDAVKRRKKADLIYRELINQRISYARAALELKQLNARQKGGWLAKKLLK